jgi:CubicO group peptidase (beta-lactamase class C family)
MNRLHLRSSLRRLGLAFLVAALAGPAAAEPDEQVLGKDQGYPIGTHSVNWYAMPYWVGSWSAMDKVPAIVTAVVPRAATPSPLPRAAHAPEVKYRYRNLGYTLDEYLERRRITGLLVLKDGEVVAERYRYGRTEDARFLSFSMAKSVTSMLMGIAVSRGAIASLDDTAAKYAKDLAGSAYGDTTIRQLLRMSSGLRFTERYDGQDDVARLSRSVAGGPPGVVNVLRGISERHAPAGEKFVYASAESEVLGRVLTAATGRSITALTAEWLWQPIGAEHDAFWRLSPDRQEVAYAFFNASLRDWGRLGLLLANDGRVGTRQVVPQAYLLDATDVSRQPEAFRPRRATPYFGYGYQFWLFPLKSRSFAMQGVHGQSVFVQPSSGIVMVQTAVYAGASGAQDPEAHAERTAFWLGLLESLGGQTD